MTDPTGLPRDLSPEQEAVRRLLADARHEGATPPEVVARLDEALASLHSERSPDRGVAEPAAVVDLGARRRRIAGIGLLAAAAVVVAGVALGQGLPGTSGGSSDAGSAAGGDGATSSHDLSEDSGGSSSGGASDSQEMAPQAKQSPRAVPTISTSDPALAERLVDLEPVAGARRRAFGSTDESQAASPYDAFCMLGIGPGRRIAADVDGQPGVLVYTPPSGDAQEVRIYVCGDGEAVRSLFLPLP